MITPDDPRHGTSAGYVAGCRDEACGCTNARRIQSKARRLRQLSGIRTWASAEEVAEAVSPWRRMGFHDGAIVKAARLSNDHALRLHRVRAATLTALLEITEDRFDQNATLPADLTRLRIQSLMAGGHPLQGMPITEGGAWRYRDRIRISLCRAIRDYYLANEARPGPSPQTSVRARNAGFPVPASWDDPGTLAWPDGERPQLDLHPVVRVATGGAPDRKPDRLEDLTWLAEAGENLTNAAERLNLTPEAIQTTCRRAGRQDVYWRLAARDNNIQRRTVAEEALRRMGAA